MYTDCKKETTYIGGMCILRTSGGYFVSLQALSSRPIYTLVSQVEKLQIMFETIHTLKLMVPDAMATSK